MKASAYREGFVDSLLGRESSNPYQWSQAISLNAYNAGFLAGQKTRKEKQITLVIERSENE